MTSIFLSILLVVFLNININILDKKTKCKGDNRNLSTKYYLIFYFLNIFCYLFLNKIREKRKINYYKYYIDFYEKNKSFFKLMSRYPSISENILNYDDKTHKKIIRYLKIKNIKN